MEMEELNKLIDDFQDVSSSVYMLEDRFNQMESFLVTPLEANSIKQSLGDIYGGIDEVREELTYIMRKASTRGKQDE